MSNAEIYWKSIESDNPVFRVVVSKKGLVTVEQLRFDAMDCQAWFRVTDANLAVAVLSKAIAHEYVSK